MAGYIKKMMKEIKKTPEELILDARIKLDEATRKNLNVIDIEARNIRHARKYSKNKTAEANSVLKIKNAYYALSIIENTRIRLVDIQTSEELYSAMNDLIEAMQKVNRVKKKSGRPSENKFARAHAKLESNMEGDVEYMTNMYSKIDSIDDLVSNDVVERIIDGEFVEDFIKCEEGISVSVEDFMTFNLEEVREYDPDAKKEEHDSLEFDFSDLK